MLKGTFLLQKKQSKDKKANINRSSKVLLKNSGVYKTGISNFHNLIFTAFETCFPSGKPGSVRQRYYKHLDDNDFKHKLIRELSSTNVQSGDLPQFANISKVVLEKQALLKESISDITKLHL